MNVLHWHLSDAESFPFQSKVWPELSKQGAYAPNAIYTADDIKSIVNYARDRGVRVLGEIDTSVQRSYTNPCHHIHPSVLSWDINRPGHTASWGNGYPEVIADCWKWLRDKNGRLEWPSWDNVALNPTRQETFDFGNLFHLSLQLPLHASAVMIVTKLFNEVIPLFPDAAFHLGGDEVATGCWNADESITLWMRENGYAVTTVFTDYHLSPLTRSNVYSMCCHRAIQQVNGSTNSVVYKQFG
jgi:hexosaminidase